MQQRLCFIGLGMMGYPMAANLRKAGYALQVLDIDQDRAVQFCREHGAQAVTNHKGLSDADVVITMLPDSEAVESALTGTNGIASALRKGAVVIDMSTCEPVRSRALGEALRTREIDYLDAPVSGGVQKAIAASLAIMVGGDRAVFDRCAPIFESLGASVFHVGAAGCGHAVKALNNYLSAITLLSVAEVLHTGQGFGLEPAVMIDVFNASSGRSNSTENKAKQYLINGAFNDGFAMKLMVKDLGIATGLGKSMGTPMRLGEVCRDTFAEALEALDGNPGHTEIYRYLERMKTGAR